MIDWEQLPQVLTLGMVAKLLSVHPNTVRNWAKAKPPKLPGFKVGSQWRFWRDELRRQVDGKSEEANGASESQSPRL